MTVEELVARFEAIALEQDDALLGNETSRFNRLYREMDELKNELKSREGDQRRALTLLYQHPNAQVRLKAAVATLALAPETARQVLQTIINGQEHPQALDAGMTLWNIERGIFKPT